MLILKSFFVLGMTITMMPSSEASTQFEFPELDDQKWVESEISNFARNLERQLENKSGAALWPVEFSALLISLPLARSAHDKKQQKAEKTHRQSLIKQTASYLESSEFEGEDYYFTDIYKTQKGRVFASMVSQTEKDSFGFLVELRETKSGIRLVHSEMVGSFPSKIIYFKNREKLIVLGKEPHWIPVFSIEDGRLARTGELFDKIRRSYHETYEDYLFVKETADKPAFAIAAVSEPSYSSLRLIWFNLNDNVIEEEREWIEVDGFRPKKLVQAEDNSIFALGHSAFGFPQYQGFKLIEKSGEKIRLSPQGSAQSFDPLSD